MTVVVRDFLLREKALYQEQTAATNCFEMHMYVCIFTVFQYII